MAGLLDLLGLVPQGVFESIPTAAKVADAMGPVKKPQSGGGVKGILNSIGEALLIAHGKAPTPYEREQAEGIQEAYGNYGTDPQGAIQKIAGYSPALAQKMQEAYDKNQADLRKEAMSNEEKSRSTAAAMLRAGSRNPTTFPAVLEQAKKYMISKGLDPSGLPDKPENVEDWAYGNMALKDQYDAENKLADNQLNRDKYNTDREYKKFQVRNAAAGRQMQAASVGVRAANSGISASRVAETVRKNNMPAKAKTRQGYSPASRPAGDKPFRVTPDGKVLRRQADGTYK